MRRLFTGVTWPPAGLRTKAMKDTFMLLTRDGCWKTPTMASNLDAALSTLGLPTDYDTIDIGALPRDDVRSGYPTPTVLYKGQDIFGMAVPQPPFAEPS